MARNRAWGGIEYGMSGGKDVRESLRLFASQFPEIAVKGLAEELVIEVGEVRRRTPFDTDPRAGDRGGELRESVRVVGPVIDGDAITAAIAAGGEEHGVLYAIAQHQKHYAHVEGEQGYIENTLDESSRFMGARLLRNMQGRLAQVMRG